MLRDEEILLPDDDERDLTSIDDAARGVVLTLARRPAGATINLGTGTLSRPSDLVQALATRTGRRPRIRTIGGEEPRRPHRAADMTTAFSTIGFAPERSIADVAQAIVDERFAERTSSRRIGSGPGPRESAPVARGEPREVSRRDLFGLFRRPK
jgi:nucleoside-diphosphate-sugar epimerase